MIGSTLRLFVWAAIAVAVAALPREVSSASRCKAVGYPNTAKYRSYILLENAFMPVYSSVDLTQPMNVTSLLIMVHGRSANANTYFCEAFAKAPTGVGVVAPYFGSKPIELSKWVVQQVAATNNNKLTSVYWDKEDSTWKSGGASDNAPYISSFAVVDALLKSIMTRNTIQPRPPLLQGRATILKAAVQQPVPLRQIIIAGFSAGGQFVQRYAWASNAGLPSTIASSGSSSSSSSRLLSGPGTRPAVRFVVSNPSTYLYFDERRADPSCRPLRDTGPSWTCSKFVAYTAASSGCKEFNTYRLGLSNIARAGPYFTQAAFKTSSIGERASLYMQKDILYLLGEQDTCNCNTKGYTNPGFCFRNDPDGSEGCMPSAVGGQNCCDMPHSTRNSFVAVSCGDMLQESGDNYRGAAAATVNCSYAVASCNTCAASGFFLHIMVSLPLCWLVY